MSIANSAHVIEVDFPPLRPEQALSRREPLGITGLRILLLTDQLTGSGSLPQTVAAACGQIARVGSVRALITSARSCTFDLILVDQRPDQFDEAAIGMLRAEGVKLPMMFLSHGAPEEAHPPTARLLDFNLPARMKRRLPKGDAVTCSGAAGNVVSLFRPFSRQLETNGEPQR